MIEPLFPLSLTVVVAVIILGVLVLLEFRREQKYLSLRIAAQVLAVSSITLLTLRPSLAIADHGSKILLTDGYDQSIIDSLSSFKPTSFNSYNELSKINGVKIITGNGLPAWALHLLPSKKFSFIPSSLPEGITAIETDEHIYTNRWNYIRGTYNGGEALIKLNGPGGIEDSVKTTGQSFSLSFLAKVPGRFNYEIITPQGSETLSLIIEPEHVFNIILVSDYPTFETRYLKNFLASKGHRLSIRNQVSRGKFKFEFANRPSTNFNSITPTVLNEADLLIIDERSWNSLPFAEQRNVKTFITDGLGVIILPEEGKTQLLPLKRSQQKDTVRLSFGRSGSVRLPALALESPGSIKLLTSADRAVNGYIYSGAGKVGYQLLTETYQAGLQGKTEIYSALWSPLLEKVARTQKQDFKLRVTSPFPYYENEPISFDIVSSGREPNLKVDSIQLPLTEDVYIDDLWHGTVWLEGNRWHEFAIDSAKTFIHVSKKGTWKAIRATNNRKTTAYHSKQNGPDNGVVTVNDNTIIKTVLFLVFLSATGFLWITPKL